MTGPRHALLKYDGPSLPPIGSRFVHTSMLAWSFTVVGMYPRGNIQRIIVSFDNGGEKTYAESQFRALISQPGFKFESMKEFEVP